MKHLSLTLTRNVVSSWLPGLALIVALISGMSQTYSNQIKTIRWDEWIANGRIDKFCDPLITWRSEMVFAVCACVGSEVITWNNGISNVEHVFIRDTTLIHEHKTFY